CGLLLVRPIPASPCSAEHLDASHRRLGFLTDVHTHCIRHVSKLPSERGHHTISSTRERWGQNTAYIRNANPPSHSPEWGFRNGQPLTVYLADVITKIANGHPNSKIDDLLPWAYAVSRDLKR